MGSKESMLQVMNIILNKKNGERMIVVVSAMSGATDTLLSCGQLSAGQNESYREIIRQSEQNHIDVVVSLISQPQQVGIIAIIKNIFTEIKEICNGIFLLGEITPRINDRLASYGELLSSNIINTLFHVNNINAAWADARALIKTNANFGNAVVHFPETNKLISDHFSQSKIPVTIVPVSPHQKIFCCHHNY